MDTISKSEIVSYNDSFKSVTTTCIKNSIFRDIVLLLKSINIMKKYYAYTYDIKRIKNKKNNNNYIIHY